MAPLPFEIQFQNTLTDRLASKGPYANPNANHYLEVNAIMQIEKSRSVVAKFTDCLNHQVTFNSGSTEGISAVFLHCYFKFKETKRKLLLISDTEHAAPLNEGAFLENHGFKVILIPTKTNGEIDTDFLTKFIDEKIRRNRFVSVVAANNETGVIQPYEKVGELCHQANILFLCDTTQILGKNSFSFKESQADFITVSRHITRCTSRRRSINYQKTGRFSSNDTRWKSRKRTSWWNPKLYWS